ncbi:MAG: DUF3108 domain-containing protein [Pseudomonadota bacterium]
MKQQILTLSLLAATLPALAQESIILPNLIEQGRHMPVLNEQTFGEDPYVIPPAPDGATQFGFEMKGYVLGLRMIRINYLGYETDTDYAAYTDLTTSGLGALLKKLDIWSVTRGTIRSEGDLRPDFHVQQNTDKKNRRVEMNYDHDAQKVSVEIVPALGSQGIPPAPPEERYSAFDTVSILLQMARQGRINQDDLCTGSVPVFDSKQRYNLRLEPVGIRRVKFLGDKQDAIHCHAYYEPVSGFDPEDLPSEEEASTPVNVYFDYVPEADLYVPMRFTYKISGFTAVIKMTQMTVIASDGTQTIYGD